MVRDSPSATREASPRDLLEAEIEAQGFFSWGFLDKAQFESVLAARHIDPKARSRYGLDSVEGVVAVALRYGEGDYLPPTWDRGPGPAVRLARFARANWYGEILLRLKRAVAGLGKRASASGLDLPPARLWKRLSNSTLPEKSLALAAGLGVLGRNGLIIAHRSRGEGSGEREVSSAILLGLLLCPVAIEGGGPWGEKESVGEAEPCGDCGRCLRACPSGALGGERGFLRERCLQNWLGREVDAPPELAAKLGDRLYGCDLCLEVCPYFRPDPGAVAELGRLGPRLSAASFMEAEDEEIRRRLKGTALGLSWMSVESFRRSARRAIGAEGPST